MKDELMKLSHDKGFRSIEIREDDIYGYIYYYRWLCELQQWLRKEHNIHIIIIPETIIQKRGIYKFYAELIWHKFEEESDENTFFNTYEECLENALKEALELI